MTVELRLKKGHWIALLILEMSSILQHIIKRNKATLQEWHNQEGELTNMIYSKEWTVEWEVYPCGNWIKSSIWNSLKVTNYKKNIPKEGPRVQWLKY